MMRHHLIFAGVGVLLAGSTLGCRAHTDAALAPDFPAPTPPAAAATPEIVFLPEMTPLGQDYTGTVRLSVFDIADYREAWILAAPSIEAAVTPEQLASISRWAADQTRSATLPRGWAARIPWEHRGSGPGGQILFAQTAQESTAELPSHSPLVRRRVIVAPVYNPATRNIARVYISIQGWAEE